MKKGDVKLSKVIIDVIEVIIIIFAILLLLYLTLFTTNIVEGKSMEPTFVEDEVLLTNKAISWIGDSFIGDALNYDYHNGDVVIFEQGEGEFVIKRIIASGGDTIKIEANEVYLNDELLDEKYIPITMRTHIISGVAATTDEGQTISIPQGQYFAMGDNREVSRDSRYSVVGLVDRDAIIGRVILRYWPLADFDFIRRGETTIGLN